MNAHQAAILMPEIPALLDRCRALAAIDAITDPDFHRYTFAPSADGGVLAMDDESRCVRVHIGGDGVLVWGWDIDHGGLEGELPDLLSAVPEVLRARLAADTRREVDWWQLSTVLWRLPSDVAWRAAPGERPGEERDPALFLLSDLTDPSPATVMWSGALGVERASRGLAGAIRHVLALRPLTEDVVRTLNPERALADVVDVVAATGYRAVEPAPAAAPNRLDRGLGEGAPLVTAAPRTVGTAGHFLLEPDGEGFHRILVHQSGKALEATGTTVGDTIVQNEPHEGESQRFLLQEQVGSAFHDVPRVPGFDVDGGEPAAGPADERAGDDAFVEDDVFVEEGTRYRIIAKGCGLALQAGPTPGDPVVLAEPDGGEGQVFTWTTLFGYGYYGRLTERTVTVRPCALPYS
ncbi:RICIN domain-containing protein [Streptomyces sp. NPDC055005]